MSGAHDNFWALTGGYLNGDLSAAERRELETLLRNDANLRQQFLAEVELDETLRSVCRASENGRSDIADKVLRSWPAVPHTANSVNAMHAAAPKTFWRRHFKQVAAAAAVLLAVGIFLALFQFGKVQPPLATIVEINGTALLQHDNTSRPLALAETIGRREAVSVAAGSSVLLSYADGTEVRLLEGSRAFIGGEPTGRPRNGSKEIFLAAGRLVSTVAPQPARQPMFINTPGAQTTVLGTTVNASCTAARTRIDVDEGRVEVSSLDGAHTALVSAGEFAFVKNAAVTVIRKFSVNLQAESGGRQPPMQRHFAAGIDYVASSVADQGSVTLEADLDQGRYAVWCRVLAASSNADSFHVAIDDGAEEVFDVAEGKWSPHWQWSQLSTRTGNRIEKSGLVETAPRILTLKTGRHKFTFRCREPNSALDAILITSDPEYVPE
jgi:ferric-dicitrate binding protein FerR (iron transport regulator)